MDGGRYGLLMAPWVDYALAHGADPGSIITLRKVLKGVGKSVFVDEHGHVQISGAAAVQRLVGLGVRRAYAVLPADSWSVSDVRVALSRPGQPMLALSASVRALHGRRGRVTDRVTWTLGTATEHYVVDQDFVAAAGALQAQLDGLLSSRTDWSQGAAWERRLDAARRALSPPVETPEGLTMEHPAAARLLSHVATLVHDAADDPSWSAEATSVRQDLYALAARALLAAANARGLPDRPLLSR